MPSFDTDKLFFFERSAATHAGKGTKDVVADPAAYANLDSLDTHWRRVLAPADTSCGPFHHNGVVHDSIDHGLLYAKARVFFPKLLAEYQSDKSKFISQVRGKKIPVAKAHEWDSANEYFALASSKYKGCKKSRDILLATQNAQLWLIRTGTQDTRLAWLEEVRESSNSPLQRTSLGSEKARSANKASNIKPSTSNKQSNKPINKDPINIDSLIGNLAKQATLVNKENKNNNNTQNNNKQNNKNKTSNVQKLNNANRGSGGTSSEDPAKSKPLGGKRLRPTKQERMQVLSEIEKEDKAARNKLRNMTRSTKLSRLIGRAKEQKVKHDKQEKQEKQEKQDNKVSVPTKPTGATDVYDRSKLVISKALMDYGAPIDKAEDLAQAIIHELKTDFKGDLRQKVFSIIRNMKKPTSNVEEADLAQRLINGTVSPKLLVAMNTRDYYPSRNMNLLVRKDRKQTKSSSVDYAKLGVNVNYSDAESKEITTWKYGHAYNMLASVLAGESQVVLDSIINAIVRYSVYAMRQSPSAKGLGQALEMKTLRVVDRLRTQHGGINGLARLKMQIPSDTEAIARLVNGA